MANVEEKRLKEALAKETHLVIEEVKASQSVINEAIEKEEATRLNICLETEAIARSIEQTREAQEQAISNSAVDDSDKIDNTKARLYKAMAIKDFEEVKSIISNALYRGK